ncbi:hypothetical protein BH10BAC4_BH10BAC4_23880 [soil metagenome]
MIKIDQELQKAERWFAQRTWKPFQFQREAWEAHLKGSSGMITAPTGSGKTYSLTVPILLEGLQNKEKKIQAIWIAPIRALAKEIQFSATSAAEGLGSSWKVGIRS